MPAEKLPFQSAQPTELKGFQTLESLGKNSDDALKTTLETLIPLTSLNDSSNSSENSKISFQIPQKQINQYHQLLKWYGIDAERDNAGNNFVGDCPFPQCTDEQKQGKFSMHVQTGMWRCFYCQAQGNVYTLINMLHSMYFSTTTTEQYELLKRKRKGAVDVDVLKDFQLAFNTATKEWMLPNWSVEGSTKGIVNLYCWRAYKDVMKNKICHQVVSGPTFKHHPYGGNRVRTATNRPLWVLEGHFDTLAFVSLLRRAGQQENFDCMGAPGGSIPKANLQMLSGRDVVLAYDNDDAGSESMDRTIRSMATNGVFPKSLRKIQWPEGLPKGFDVSDVITHLPHKLVPRKKKLA